jgi:hypothetical protein
VAPLGFRPNFCPSGRLTFAHILERGQCKFLFIKCKVSPFSGFSMATSLWRRPIVYCSAAAFFGVGCLLDISVLQFTLPIAPQATLWFRLGTAICVLPCLMSLSILFNLKDIRASRTFWGMTGIAADCTQSPNTQKPNVIISLISRLCSVISRLRRCIIS